MATPLSDEQKARRRSINKKIIFGAIGAFVLMIIIAGIFAPSKEELAAEQRTKDSLAAIRSQKEAADREAAAAAEKARWEALPKKTRDSVLAANRTDSLATIKAERESEMASNPERFLSVKNFSWEKGGFGHVGLVKMNIKNEGVRAARDVVIKVDFNGESGTTLNTYTKTVSIVVPPGKSKATGELNLGFIDEQAETASAEIVTASFDPAPASN